MMDQINHSEKEEVSNFANLVTPEDEMSEKLLNYVASIKARDDAIHFLESKFNEESISFEDFLKNIRKLEESKFVERFMLQETLQNYSQLQ
jgi:predicted acetyltransferase